MSESAAHGHARYLGTCVICKQVGEGPSTQGGHVVCYACLNKGACEKVSELQGHLAYLKPRLAASERRVEELRFEIREVPKRMIESACVAIRSACFACGGSGYARLPERVRTGEVSRDMATDACAPEMEGQPIYQDSDGEECQYCGWPIAAIRARSAAKEGE